MRKYILAFFATLATLACAQSIQTSGGAAAQNVPPAYVTPDCTLTGTLTAVGVSTMLNNSDTGCSTWNLTYDTNFASLSIEVDFASQSAVFGVAGSFTVWPGAQVGNGTLPLTTATEGAVTLSGYHPYVEVNLTAKTGTGSVKYKLYGWKGQGSSDVVNSAGAVAQTVTSATQTDATSNTISYFTGQTAQVITYRVFPFYYNGTTWDRAREAGLTGAASTIISPSGISVDGITPIVSGAVESNHVLKASAGNFYGACITTGATAGFMMVFNATSAPADGAVTPTEWLQIAANATACLSYGSGPPNAYATGITLVFSSTGPFTKTASATAAFVGRIK